MRGDPAQAATTARRATEYLRVAPNDRSDGPRDSIGPAARPQPKALARCMPCRREQWVESQPTVRMLVSLHRARGRDFDEQRVGLSAAANDTEAESDHDRR